MLGLWREKEERSKNGEEQLLSVSQYLGVVEKEDESRSESLEDYKVCKEKLSPATHVFSE